MLVVKRLKNSNANLHLLLHNKVKLPLANNSELTELNNKSPIKHRLPHRNKLKEPLELAQSLVVVVKLLKLRKPHLWVLVVLAQLLLPQCPELLWLQMLVLLELVNLLICSNFLLLLILPSEAPNG
jgi:hypothetical protein